MVHVGNALCELDGRAEAAERLEEAVAAKQGCLTARLCMGAQHFMNKMGEPGSPDERFVDVFRGGALLTRCAHLSLPHQPRACLVTTHIPFLCVVLSPYRKEPAFVHVLPLCNNETVAQGQACPPKRQQSGCEAHHVHRCASVCIAVHLSA